MRLSSLVAILFNSRLRFAVSFWDLPLGLSASRNARGFSVCCQSDLDDVGNQLARDRAEAHFVTAVCRILCPDRRCRGYMLGDPPNPRTQLDKVPISYLFSRAWLVHSCPCIEPFFGDRMHNLCL